MGDPEKWVRDTLDSRQADHGLRPPRLPRRGSALADPEADARASSGRRRSRSPSGSRRRRSPSSSGASPDRPLKTNVEYYSALVLDVAEVPPPLAPAMFACSRVAGWSAHILEQKRTGTPLPAVGALRRPGRAHAAGGLGFAP